MDTSTVKLQKALLRISKDPTFLQTKRTTKDRIEKSITTLTRNLNTDSYMSIQDSPSIIQATFHLLKNVCVLFCVLVILGFYEAQQEPKLSFLKSRLIYMGLFLFTNSSKLISQLMSIRREAIAQAIKQKMINY